MPNKLLGNMKDRLVHLPRVHGISDLKKIFLRRFNWLAKVDSYDPLIKKDDIWIDASN